MLNAVRLVTVSLFYVFMASAQAESPALMQEEVVKPKVNTKPLVRMTTTEGVMVIKLYGDKAPISAVNFLQYVREGFYDGVIFHRIIPGFVVQAGGFDQNYQRKAVRQPIVNESNNGLKNTRGTLSMARTSDPNSATSQFFINLQNNANLDWAPGRPGYAVFGEVIEGLDVLDKLAALPQGEHSGVFANAPNEQAVILKAEMIEASAKQ